MGAELSLNNNLCDICLKRAVVVINNMRDNVKLKYKMIVNTSKIH